MSSLGLTSWTSSAASEALGSFSSFAKCLKATPPGGPNSAFEALPTGPGGSTASDRHGHVSLYRHRGQHGALGARPRGDGEAVQRHDALMRMRSKSTAATSLKPSATHFARPSRRVSMRRRGRARRATGIGTRKISRQSTDCACAWRCTPATPTNATATTSDRPSIASHGLMSIGHGGQMLLSGALRELSIMSFPPQCSLRDLGSHRLKDLTNPNKSGS